MPVYPLPSKCTSMQDRTHTVFTVPCTQNYYYSILINTKDCGKALPVRDTYLSEGVRFPSASECYLRRFPVVLALSLFRFVGSPKRRPACRKKYETPLRVSLLIVTLDGSQRVSCVKN